MERKRIWVYALQDTLFDTKSERRGNHRQVTSFVVCKTGLDLYSRGSRPSSYCPYLHFPLVFLLPVNQVFFGAKLHLVDWIEMELSEIL
jgi:hypothetical protein